MDKYVKATKYGRLYIETKDFFKIPSVIETINRLKNCSVVRKLEYEKEQRRKIELAKTL